MKVALVQMTSGKDVKANLAAAKSYIEQAAEQHADMVVLPEMFACLGVKNQTELARDFFSQGGLVRASLAKWAKNFNLAIVAGSMPLPSSQEDKVLAACILFDGNGAEAVQYNKIHLFDVDVGDEKGSYRESDTFVAGTSPQVWQHEDIKLGLSVCYDLRFPELYQVYQGLECNLITVPSAFTYTTGKKHWEVLLKARAIETQSFVLAANQVGLHEDGRRTWGQSMVVSPSGDILAQLDSETTGLLCLDIDLDEVSGIRDAMPLKNHKRLNLPYKSS